MYQTMWLGIIHYSDSEYFDLGLGLSRILLLIGNNSVVWLDIVVQKKRYLIADCFSSIQKTTTKILMLENRPKLILIHGRISLFYL